MTMTGDRSHKLLSPAWTTISPLDAVDFEISAMPDIYATITALDPSVLDQLARVLELRATDAQQQRMRAHYFGQIPFPSQARVLEIGCGTGAVTRALATWPEVAAVTGVDPSPALLERARQLSKELPHVTFETGDARSLPLRDDIFDAVVFHTTLCHIPQPSHALAEAFRVLKPGGTLAIFDANYAETTLATDAVDPLQVCAQAAVGIIAFDPWLIPRLKSLVRSAGFELGPFNSYIYDGANPPDYMLTIVDRGADALHSSGRIGHELAAAFKSEARRRVLSGEFFGQITYASLIARKPLPARTDIPETPAS